MCHKDFPNAIFFLMNDILFPCKEKCFLYSSKLHRPHIFPCEHFLFPILQLVLIVSSYFHCFLHLLGCFLHVFWLSMCSSAVYLNLRLKHYICTCVVVETCFCFETYFTWTTYIVWIWYNFMSNATLYFFLWCSKNIIQRTRELFQCTMKLLPRIFYFQSELFTFRHCICLKQTEPLLPKK